MKPITPRLAEHFLFKLTWLPLELGKHRPKGGITIISASRPRFVFTGAEFTSFGAVALLLEQVPIVGALFQITNFVGAALWVEKLDAE